MPKPKTSTDTKKIPFDVFGTECAYGNNGLIHAVRWEDHHNGRDVFACRETSLWRPMFYVRNGTTVTCLRCVVLMPLQA